VIYLLVNVSYLHRMTLDAITHAPQDRVGTAAAQVLFGGAGAALMAVGIMISTFGCNNGLILSGARVYYAMARDGLFFKRAGVLDEQRHTPTFGLWAQALWTCVLCLSGSYGDLLNYVIFAAVLFYFLTVIALFRLRSLQPNAERPYTAVGYPWLQLVYCILLGAIMIDLLIKSPSYTWPGLIIVLIGVPVFYIWRKVGGGAMVQA
jgi:APA family basic amino acid/polyamine antiporter